jgi:hypothetical protein
MPNNNKKKIEKLGKEEMKINEFTATPFASHHPNNHHNK